MHRTFLRSWAAGLVACLALHLGLPAAGGAAKPIFAWIDGEGALHATDRLQDVPEPFYSTYRARADAVARAERAAASTGTATVDAPSAAGTAPLPPPPGPSGVGAAAQQRDARASWQAKVAQARSALVDATLRLQQAERELQVAHANPLLVYTPAGKGRVAAAQEGLARARREALVARQRLLSDLPAEARAQHVPPQWLF